jgi:hypothetical protein
MDKIYCSKCGAELEYAPTNSEYISPRIYVKPCEICRNQLKNIIDNKNYEIEVLKGMLEDADND